MQGPTSRLRFPGLKGYDAGIKFKVVPLLEGILQLGNLAEFFGVLYRHTSLNRPRPLSFYDPPSLNLKP